MEAQQADTAKGNKGLMAGWAGPGESNQDRADNQRMAEEKEDTWGENYNIKEICDP